ncbi:MAG: hypothetical protein HY931_00935 [Candidatus Falkowbacteria bacterium]|nr:MAG: hypothetical protein HY931_00935 [Candidatus Falkowbacteria bacterium]
MRILLHGNYEGQAFVLRKENGDVYQRIEPNTIFGIGDFISYFAKRIWWSRQPFIALITLGPNEDAKKIRNLKRSRQKGFILKPGKGLWATSFGSAHRGVWHLLKTVSDPILIALWSHELPSDFLQTVSEIDTKVYEGGNLCEHSRGAGNYNFSFATDGNTAELRRQVFGKHPRGKFCPIREATIQVVGGTYCVQSVRRKENNGKIYPKVTSVIITADADKAEVAKIIHQMMR